MAKKKFYVVWKGVRPGVYSSWDECKAQVSGFEHARYKSFETQEEADAAFNDNPWKHIGKTEAKTRKTTPSKEKYLTESIAVDAACSGNPGLMEYRGVFVADGAEIFHVGPLNDGTNNIGEFLAIVHALALRECHEMGGQEKMQYQVRKNQPQPARFRSNRPGGEVVIGKHLREPGYQMGDQ